MNFQALRPEDEEDDPLAPIKRPEVEAPSVAAPKTFAQTAGGGGGSAPAPAPGGVAILQQQLPEQVKRSEWHGPQTTTKSQEQSPESAMLLSDISRTNQEEREALERKEAHDQTVREAEAMKAEKDAINAELLEREKVLARQRHEELVKSKLDPHIKAREAEVAQHKNPSTYWEDKSVPAKIFAALMVGLNGFARTGKGMGGGNVALEIYNRAEDQDRQAKLDKYTRSKEFLELAKNNKVAAEEALKKKILDIEDLSIARGKRLAADSEAVLSRLKIPQAKEAAAMLRAETERKAAESELKQRQIYERDITRQDPYSSGSTTTNIGGAGSSAKPPPDLTVTTPDGKVRHGRTPEEAEKLRDQAAALESARQIAEKLKELGKKKGRFPDPAIENQIRIEAGNLLEKKKEITGALTKDDRDYFNSQVVPGLFRGSESTNKAVDGFIGGMETTLRANINHKTVDPTRAASPQASPASAPRAEVPAKPDRKTMLTHANKLRRFLDSPEAKRDPEKARRAREALRAIREQ